MNEPLTDRRSKPRSSIRHKLFRFFLFIGLVPSISTLLLLFFGVSQYLENQIGQNVHILAREAAIKVDIYLENKLQNTKKYSSYSTLKRIFFTHTKNYELNEFSRSLFKFDNELRNLLIFDTLGNSLFSYKETSQLSKITQAITEYYRVHSLDKELIVPSETEIFFIIPLKSDLIDKTLGLLCLSYDRNSLASLFESIGRKNDPYILLIDQSQDVIACSNIDHRVLSARKIHNHFMDTAKKDTEWEMRADPVFNEDSLIGYAPVKTLSQHSIEPIKWWILVSQGYAIAFKPIKQFLLQLFIVCVVLILLILIILSFKVESLWAPILSLKKGAERIGSGDLDTKLFIPTSDELEDLAHSFNKMGKNLKENRLQLENQNKRLKELNEIKNHFLSMVSHELRTPLMIIKESLSQVLEGLKGPLSKDQEEFLSMGLRNSLRLNQIVDDLLCISRIETGRMNIKRSRIDIIELVRHEVENHRIKSDEKKQTVGMSSEIESLFIYADPEKIQMIVTNLLSNAIKFTPVNGLINITIGTEEQQIFVKVKDTGPGIPQDSVIKVFDRFVRLNRTPLIGAPSTGLGLAIAKELVEMHQGKIWVESDGEHGSEFTFTLPLLKNQDLFPLLLHERQKEAAIKGFEFSLLKLCLSIPEEINAVDHPIVFQKSLKKLEQDFSDSSDWLILEESLTIYLFLFLDHKSAELTQSKIQNMKPLSKKEWQHVRWHVEVIDAGEPPRPS